MQGTISNEDPLTLCWMKKEKKPERNDGRKSLWHQRTGSKEVLEQVVREWDDGTSAWGGGLVSGK